MSRLKTDIASMGTKRHNKQAVAVGKIAHEWQLLGELDEE
jgi:hypothetical protein